MLPNISIVIPLRNEAPNLSDLHHQLTEALGVMGRSYELVFVDDGSTDGTFELLAKLQASDDRVCVIRLRRNFGQTAAFAAGIAYSHGELIVTCDGDLQNDPQDIPAMVDKIEQGYDIVCGWRRDRKDSYLTRRIPSILASRLISLVTGVPLHDYGCSLKVFRSEVIKPLKLYGEMHRFIPAIASANGVRVAEVEVKHRARQHGVSKYGLSRTARVILDLVTVKFLLSYSTRPIQIFGLIGLFMGVIGVVIVGWWAYFRLFVEEAIGNSSLPMLGILLIFMCVQFVVLGLLAELQVRTYHESQDKPIYVVRDILDSSDISDSG